jgi:uroporphyrinogen decarboxylase
LGEKTVTSKERVLAAINHQEPDRVPVNYFGNADIDRRLKEHFGLAHDDCLGLREKLHVDILNFAPEYKGPELHKPVEGRKINEMGIHTRWVEHGSGGYWDYCDFPLKDASDELFETWPLPNPDDYDFLNVLQVCRAHPDMFLALGHPGVADIINTTGMLAGMEDVLVFLADENEAFLHFVDRMNAVQLGWIERTLEAAGGAIDMLWMGEDLGTQIAPIIGLKMYRDLIRPRHQKFIDLAKSYNLNVMIHSCGSSSAFFNDFIEMGIDAVDTLQPEAARMSPEYLKETYGKQLAFHGCISTAGTLAGGTVDEVIADCRTVLETMMPGGGYCFAPTHCIQDNSPTENVLAMYEAAQQFGRY